LQFENFRANKQIAHDGGKIIADSIIAENPNYYNAYIVAGDYCYKNNHLQQALQYYKKALTLEIASAGERKHAEKMIQKIIQKLK
jgi:tetratricopeptide (TPR) repeat protein